MKQVATIIKQLQNTSGTNDKINILKKNSDNELLKRSLFYTYSPYLKYGITEQVFEEYKIGDSTLRVGDIFSLLDILANNNINDQLREQVVAFVEAQDEDVRDLVKGMLIKDLKIGANATTINKVWDDLIPVFDVMLAQSLAKQKDNYLNGKHFALTTKLDGFRCVYLPNEKKFYTRQGQVYEGIDHLIEECDKISQGIYVLDGELLYRNNDNLPSDELYRLTTSVARKKGKTKEKTNLEFHLFDIIPLSEFQKGESIDVYRDRMALLERLHAQAEGLDFLKRVTPLYVGDDASHISTLLDEVVAQGEEGLMLNLLDGKYECKRSKNILKIKQFHDADVLVVDVYEGKKDFKGTLGGLKVKFLLNGKELVTDVGSGYSKSEREQFFNYPETIIGKVIEIKYFEVSSNKKGGNDLRFATYQHRIREDKNADEITDVAIV